MKIKDGYVLREVAGVWVVLPLSNVDFHGMIKLNDTGALLWTSLEKGACNEELVKALLSEYDVTADQAAKDVESFLKLLSEFGCLDT